MMPALLVSRRWAVALAVTLTLAGCAGGAVGPEAVAGQPRSGTIEIHAPQAAFFGTRTRGSGTLVFRGRSYPFTIGGAGIGGIGASSIDGHGEVYNLKSIEAFPGTYAQGRYGYAAGSKSGGDLWLQNDEGVIIHVKAKREGLMLSLGGDAMVIALKK